jgi:hypothetical protein
MHFLCYVPLILDILGGFTMSIRRSQDLRGSTPPLSVLALYVLPSL